jgi:hypothetical protein
MRALIVVSLLTLHGCVAYIPGSMIQAAGDKLSGLGEHCINVHARVGQPVAVRDGDRMKSMRVEAITGPAPDRCRDPDVPIRARLSPM